MAKEIFNIVAKNPKKKHIARDVSETGVQKQAGYQREKRANEIDVPGNERWEAHGNHGIGHQEGFKRVWGERDFVQENSNIRADEQNVNDWESPVRVKIFEWNEHGEPRSE